MDEIKQRARLLKLIVYHFSREEFKTLVYVMGYDYESFSDVGKEVMVREFLLLLERRCRLPELLTILKLERPEIDWGEAEFPLVKEVVDSKTILIATVLILGLLLLAQVLLT